VKSVLALVLAAAMVVGALYLRDRFDDGEGLGPIGAPDEPLHLVCAEEFKAVCSALAGDDVTVEVREAGETAAALSAPEPPEADGWVTLQPWPQIVEEARARRSLDVFPGEPLVVGRSPLVMAAWDDRVRALSGRCGATLSWSCVGKNAGNPWGVLGGQRLWGRVKPGFGEPSLNATGLLVLGQATSDFLGTSAFSVRDFDEPKFQAWLTNLGTNIPTTGGPGASPLQQMLQRGRSIFDFVGTTEAEAGPALQRAAPDRRQGLQLLYPKPMVVAEAVVAPLRAGADERLRDLFSETGAAALANNGWRVAGQDRGPGVPTTPALPKEANIPKAGVLEALRIRWGEIAR
jgi:hypothetical protein